MGEAKTRALGAAGAAAMMAAEGVRAGTVIRSERCENCKWGVENAPGLPPGAIQCHGGPPSGQAIFAPDEKGNMRQVGLATVWPAMNRADPLSFCAAWKPRISLL